MSPGRLDLHAAYLVSSGKPGGQIVTLERGRVPPRSYPALPPSTAAQGDSLALVVVTCALHA
jgi:hypothetical protein